VAGEAQEGYSSRLGLYAQGGKPDGIQTAKSKVRD